MKQGNCNVQPNETLFYVAWDDIALYENKTNKTDIRLRQEIPQGEEDNYAYSQISSQDNFENFKTWFLARMQKQFKSMHPCDYWLGRSKHVILENKLFMIALEDNDWSLAIELLRIGRKQPNLKGLQNQMFQNFVNGLRNNLLTYFPVIYIRTGNYLAQPVTKNSIQSTTQRSKTS